MVPGRMLHRLAGHLCSTKALERVIEPAIADLQKEYGDAIRGGRVWYGRRILFAGYVGFAKAIAICGIDWMLSSSLDMGLEERRAIGRTLVWGGLIIVAMTVAMVIPPLQSIPSRAPVPFKNLYVLASISQALPLAIPVGLTLGVLAGLDRRSVTRRLRERMLALAAACALLSLVILCWIMPAANQAFRAHVAQATGDGYPMKGANEMTLGELSREIEVAAASGLPSRARELRFAYDLRWSLACGVVALAFFASTVSKQGFALRFMLGVVACGLYWALLLAGDELSRANLVPVLLGAWLPNLAFIGMSAGLLNKSRQRF